MYIEQKIRNVCFQEAKKIHLKVFACRRYFEQFIFNIKFHQYI